MKKLLRLFLVTLGFATLTTFAQAAVNAPATPHRHHVAGKSAKKAHKKGHKKHHRKHQAK